MLKQVRSSSKKEKTETIYSLYKMVDSLAKNKASLIFSNNTSKDKYLVRLHFSIITLEQLQ